MSTEPQSADSLSFSNATLADTDTVAAMMREFYDYFGDIEYDEVESPAVLRALLSDDAAGRVLLIRASDEPIGYLALTFGMSLEFRGRVAMVDEFYIRAAYRGRGYGKRALAFVEQVCRAANVRMLFLEVDRDNPEAQRLYRNAGFAPRDLYLFFCKRVPA